MVGDGGDIKQKEDEDDNIIKRVGNHQIDRFLCSLSYLVVSKVNETHPPSTLAPSTKHDHKLDTKDC